MEHSEVSPRTGRSEQIAPLLTAIVELIGTWSRVDVQAQVAREAGLQIADSDVRALYTLGSLDAPTPPSVLAASLDVSRPTMSKMLGRMNAAGLIRRIASEADGRSASVLLSPEGRAVFDRLDRAGIELVDEATRDLDAAELAEMTTALRRLTGRFTEKTPDDTTRHD
ncbi:MarR family winged helix-turn-helix transcriptional regulator [Gulosibacter sp. 10]|uniref:MarR family winged helix-turn-helix transcriptional regulator n=1 Tax=Gulosibacter sp. 10 TaxID=1255570 RepID=UPI000B354E85|nr:MarR family transcriptional regulator [Gulosibacter sp. 10]